MKNRGIDIEKEKREQSKKDWHYKDKKFGAVFLQDMAYIPAEDRFKYLPQGELQYGKEDFMDCATRGVLNIIETKLNYLYQTNQLPEPQWWLDNGYITEKGFELADRFNAYLSGTTRFGNSIKAPLDSVRKDGIVPKKLLPANSQMTFNDYYKKTDITDNLISLGQHSIKLLSFNYEKVFNDHFSTFDDLLDVAGAAWPSPINGVYPKMQGEPNHVWVNIKPQYDVFDNYIDSSDGDFIKRLAPDYVFYDYGYRIVVFTSPQVKYLNILQAMVKLLNDILNSKLVKGVGEVLAGLFNKRN